MVRYQVQSKGHYPDAGLSGDKGPFRVYRNRQNLRILKVYPKGAGFSAFFSGKLCERRFAEILLRVSGNDRKYL